MHNHRNQQSQKLRNVKSIRSQAPGDSMPKQLFSSQWVRLCQFFKSPNSKPTIKIGEITHHYIFPIASLSRFKDKIDMLYMIKPDE